MLTKTLEEYANENKLEINTDKTKMMVSMLYVQTQLKLNFPGNERDEFQALVARTKTIPIFLIVHSYILF